AAGFFGGAFLAGAFGAGFLAALAGADFFAGTFLAAGFGAEFFFGAGFLAAAIFFCVVLVAISDYIKLRFLPPAARAGFSTLFLCAKVS
ncbi:MAG: hypothetical protein IJI37_04095, partial [Opitutales bacterium]|nr:hypothetical protein [Opitutales bacterium]